MDYNPLVPLPFWKYHGLGNDFVVVEGVRPATPEEAVRLCDRRRGIGADGVLSILPARAGGTAFMAVVNSDGSHAAMCGNGVRCVARHLAERRSAGWELVVETDGGPKRCIVHRRPGGAVDDVTVEMGPARYEGEEILLAGSERVRAHRVSMGNPHAVAFGEAPRERAARLGPLLQEAVPGGVNAGFAQLRAGALELVVWERGAGLTEACGTGACAAAVAAVKAGLLQAEVPVEVKLPGGRLRISVSANGREVSMRGPAELAFEGVTSLVD